MKIIVYCSLLLFSLSLSCFAAEISKGSLGGNKSKFYHFTSLDDGHVTVTCIFDNKAANVDIGLAVGDQLVAAGISSQNNYEQLKTGTIFGTPWTILLLNEKGAGTPYRLIVEGGEAQDIANGASLSAEFLKLERKLRATSELVRRFSLRPGD